MKKLIFKKFTKDLTYFFLLTSVSITLIVWVIQAVNFLDIVTEDGHGFRIYFLYTLLSLPKIFSKILPFIYFVSLFYIILKYENNNELLIFWSIGIKKLHFINVLVKFSIIYLLIQLFFTIYLVPITLDKGRSFIRASNVELFSSIIKEKKFIDTVKNLTIFVDKKNNDRLENIFLKEKINDTKYQIIVARNGKITNKNNKSILLLYDGKVLNNNNEQANSFNFSETELNLSKFTTKTTTHPKMQEIATEKIISCIILLKDLNNKEIIIPSSLTNCNLQNLQAAYQEIFKRIVLPFYLPLLSLIACLIVIKSKDDYKFSKYKLILFILGITVIIMSELSTKYSGINIMQNFALVSIPMLLFILIYSFLIKKFTVPKLLKK